MPLLHDAALIRDSSLLCHRNWSAEEYQKSSTSRECFAIKFALEAFGAHLAKQRGHCKTDNQNIVMHQSIPAVPFPQEQPWGICSRCQSWGWDIRNFIAARDLGICVPRGEPGAFDTRLFEVPGMSSVEKTRYLWSNGLSVRD